MCRDSVNLNGPIVLDKVTKARGRALYLMFCIYILFCNNKQTSWSVEQRSRPTCVTWHLAIADLLESLLVGFAIVVDLGLCG